MKNWDYKWQVVACVVFGAFMVIMDATIVNVALPTLQRQLGGTVAEIQWIISAYTLSLGVITPLSGFLADKYGIKRVFLLSLAFFTFGSLLCALAPNLGWMIVFRVVQGLGGGSVLPLGTALLFGAFPPKERGLALGIFGIPLVFAPALGPVLGGAFVEYLDWRLIFLVNIPIGILGVFIGAKFLREKTGEGRQRFDWLGITFSTLAFGLILYGFSSTSGDGWGAPNVLTSLIVGGVFLVGFIAVELWRSDGLVDLRLFRLPIFTISNIIGWLTVIGFFGAEFLMPLYLQTVRGLTPLQSGLMLLPLAITSGFLVPIAGKFLDKIGARPLVTAGFALLVVNTWQLSQVERETSLWWIGILLALRGVALACVIQATQVTALSVVEPPKLPRASSLVNGSRLVFQSLGVAVLATILNATVGGGGQISEGGASTAQIPPEALVAFQEKFVLGLENAYLATFYVSLVGVAMALLLPGWPARAKKAEAPGSKTETLASDEASANVTTNVA